MFSRILPYSEYGKTAKLIFRDCFQRMGERTRTMKYADYRKKRNLKRDCRRLYAELSTNTNSFCEELLWLVEKYVGKAVCPSESDMWKTYFAAVKKIDRELFSPRLYSDQNYEKVYPVFDKLFKKRYYERLVQLALGAASIFEMLNDREASENAEILCSIANKYMDDLTFEMRQILDGAKMTTEHKWEMIRMSTRFFAEVYDIVEKSSLAPGDSIPQSYLRELAGHDARMRRLS